MNQNEISIWQRFKAPMPLFFQVIFIICLCILLLNLGFGLVTEPLFYTCFGAALICKFTVDYKALADIDILSEITPH
jgi:hypothetical protein